MSAPLDPERFALGEDGRDQDGARMAVQRDVVIVEHVRGNAVDQRRIVDVATAERRDEGGKRAAVGCGQLAIDEGDDGVAGAGDHHAEAVGETGLRDVPGLARNVRKREADTNAPRSAVREAMMLPLHAAHACRRRA